MYIFIFVLGLLIGSFLNSLIWRINKKVSFSGRSMCPKCRHMISWYDNIPVFSFIFLRGKCRHCHAKISWQYPLVELVTGILFVLAFQFTLHASRFTLYENILLFRNLFIVSIMVVIFIYDLRWFLILDVVTVPAIIAVFVANIFLGESLVSMIISMAIGGGFFLAQFLVSRGKWIGGGDIRVGILMGTIFVQPFTTIFAIMAAYIIGSIVGLLLIFSGKKKLSSKLPLGVFLSVSTLLMLFFGEYIMAWYLKLF